MKKDENRYAPKSFSLWTYTLPGDWTVMAGKTDADNDRLSLKIAGPDDWWFHVRGMPGSHVILRSKPGQEPDGGVIAVSCTRARFVTKPKGAKPGTVHIRKESVIKVRPALPSCR